MDEGAEKLTPLVYSGEIEYVVKMWKEKGKGNGEFLRKILENEHGVNHRKKLVEKYAPYLGMDVKSALQLAHNLGLIPNARRAPKSS